MPARLFFELNKDKQQQIISAAAAEFAEHGFTNASTNTIVKNAGISKGSLFKYFANKEDIYFYILDTVTAELVGFIEKEMHTLSPELFQRVIDYSALEFSWFIQNPIKAGMLLNASLKSDTGLREKTAERYGTKELDIFYKLLEDIDLQPFRWDKQKTADVLKWFLKGFNEDFLEGIQMERHSFEYLQNEYTRSLTEYMEILKFGILQ